MQVAQEKPATEEEKGSGVLNWMCRDTLSTGGVIRGCDVALLSYLP
jgi:hypothetical protein